MKYKKGDVFYKENKKHGKLEKIEIKEVVYVISKGTLDGKKYVTDKDIERALAKGVIALNDDIYKKKKIEEKRLQIEKLQKELDAMEGK